MWIRWVSLVARLGLAGVLLTSGSLKAAQPMQTTVAVGAYQILPDDLVTPVANVLPFLEIGVGLFLLVGLGVRIAAGVAASMLVVLIGAVASAWARGLSIDCGCFGGGGHDASVNGWDYASEILRDVGFMALAAWLMIFPRSPFAIGPRSRSTRPDHEFTDADDVVPEVPQPTSLR